MPTVHQDQVEKSIAHLLYDLAGAFVALLVYIGHWSVSTEPSTGFRMNGGGTP